MRATFLLVPLLAVASPALAQSPAAPQAVDPASIDRLADGMQALSKALLNVRVGEVQAALQGREATAAEKRLTVRDIGRRNDPDFERHLDQRIAAARPKIEQSIQAVNAAIPQITQDLQRAQRAVERALANMPDPNYPKR